MSTSSRMACAKVFVPQDLEWFSYGHEAILGEGTGTAVFNEWRLNANGWIVSMNDWKWALSSQPNVFILPVEDS